MPDAKNGKTSEKPGAKIGEAQDLHLGVPKFAPGRDSNCTKDTQDLHLGVPESTYDDDQTLHTRQLSKTSYSKNISTGDIWATDDTSFMRGTKICKQPTVEELQHNGLGYAYIKTMEDVKKQIQYLELINDIDTFMDSSYKAVAIGLTDLCIRIMAEDALKGENIQIGKEVYHRSEVMSRYEDIDEYIMYAVVEKTAQHIQDIKNTSEYLHQVLLHAVEQHSGEAYFIQKRIRKLKEEQSVQAMATESAWPWKQR